MNNCYSLYKTGLAFPAAQTACANQQGKMVSWNSYQEQVGTATPHAACFGALQRCGLLFAMQLATLVGSGDSCDVHCNRHGESD
jgi:hypothetical protein